ncbi:MAG: ArsR family transcriptional regulator [Proteobacteria bacterium]|nr:MAG: ArsR family transcriptional regulator [Pseudomonadota bacterium]
MAQRGADLPGDSIFAQMGLLSDPTRARILRVLEREELGVGELSRVLQLPQSTVSRHLKALLLHGWIERRAEGASSRVRMSREAPTAEATELWTLVRDDPSCARGAAEDRVRLEDLIALRQVDSRAFFGRVAARWDALRDELFGDGFTLPALTALLPPSWTVVDLGCGTGEALARLAPSVARVIGVDQEASMIEAARARLAGRDNVELVEAGLSAVPLPDALADAALLVLVLHHLPEPAEALREARRLLRPGGALVVVDMVAHDRGEYRQTMGHLHLGFSAEGITALAAAAGLTLDDLRQLPAVPDAQGPALFVARLVCP